MDNCRQRALLFLRKERAEEGLKGAGSAHSRRGLEIGTWTFALVTSRYRPVHSYQSSPLGRKSPCVKERSDPLDDSAYRGNRRLKLGN